MHVLYEFNYGTNNILILSTSMQLHTRYVFLLHTHTKLYRHTIILYVPVSHESVYDVPIVYINNEQCVDSPSNSYSTKIEPTNQFPYY